MQPSATNRLVPVLVILLIVASFLIGSLYTKVNMLEKGTVAGTTGTKASNAPTQAYVEPTPVPVDIDISNQPRLGGNNAKVALVEFTDYQCPFCKRFFDGGIVTFKKEYVDTGKVAYFSMDFPLNQIHPQAQKAAEAAQCANEQSKFWEYHDKLFTNQEALKIEDLKKHALNLGLNSAQFNTCLDSGKYTKLVSDDQELGSKYGVRGTPASFVGILEGNTVKQAKLVSGAVPFETLKTEIDALLK